MLNFLTKNIHLKVLALLSAVFLWIYVINEGYRVDFLDAEIPIETHNLAEDLAVANDLGTVKLKVRAPSYSWQRISKEKISAFVDLKNLRQGAFSKEVKVSIEDPAVSILEKDPATVNIVLEPIQTLRKEVVVQISGEVGEEYETQEPIIFSEEVEVKGARSAVDKVNKVVAPVELFGEMTEVKREVELEAFDSSNEKVKNVVIVPKTAEVTIPIRKRSEIKTIGVKASIIGDPASGYWVKQVTIEPAAVVVQGNTEQISQLEYLSTQQIDISGISATTDRRIGLDLPPGVNTVDSSEVTVKIEIITQTVSKSLEVTPRYTGLTSDLEVASASPDRISIQVEGPAPKLDSLKESDISAVIGLKGKATGSFTINISPDMISLPSDVGLKDIDTKSIKITIRKKK
jgi:YbbR domain-containing protein